MNFPPASEPDARRRRPWRFVFALAVIAALLACFFETPLRKFETHSYTAADLTQDYSLTKIERAHVPGNRLLSDPVTEMLPWLLHNRNELGAGRIPLWNDHNASGVPHLANFQSAVFSPFSAPFYWLDLKTALLVSAALKLGALALFTFLFLDLLGLGTVACMVGATAFAFSGHNVLLLSYPHSAAVLAMPAGLYFAERALSRSERGQGILGACFGLTLTFGVGLLCGQPEPFYFSVLLVALWCAARLIAMTWREWLATGQVRASLWTAGRIAFASAIGACLGAPQVLPFLEYLKHSTILVWRSSDQTPLNMLTWALYAFPDLLGNPSLAYHYNYAIPPPNYESANTCYLGAFAMLAALVGLSCARRAGAARFFGAVSILWFLYAYDVFGIAKLAAVIPTLGLAPINRSQPIGLFAMGACAAIAVHTVGSIEVKARWKWALATFLIGGGALWSATVAGWTFFKMIRGSGYAKALPAGSDAYLPEHMQFIVVTFALGLAALIALWFAQRKWIRVPLQLAILVVVFLQSGWVLRDYNPTVEDRFVYPKTPAIEQLVSQVGREPLVILGSDTIPPHTNGVYGINSLSSYDAMWIRRYDELYREAFGLGGGNWRLALQASVKGMKRFGARTVASPGSWIKVDSLCDEVLISQDDLYTTAELTSGTELVQTILGQRDRLQGIALQFSVPRRVSCSVTARLEDRLTGLLVASKTWRTDDWVNDRFARHEELFDFEPMPNSRHRSLRLVVSSPDASPGNAVSLWARDDYWYWNQFVLLRQPLREVVWNLEPTMRRFGWRPHGRLSVGAKPIPGGLVMDQTYDLEHWNIIGHVPGFTLGQLAEPVPRYGTVSRGIAARKIGQDFFLTHYGNLDARNVVVLSYPPGPVIDSSRGRVEGGEPEVEILREDSDHIRLRVTRDSPGYMVLRRAHYPGWEARVNGATAPVLRADYAFCAVELGAGESTVDFSYRPATFRHGLWIALLAPLIGGLLFFVTRKHGRVQSRPE